MSERVPRLSRLGAVAACATLGLLATAPAGADEAVTLPDVEVVGVAPLLGSGVDRGRVPTRTDVLNHDDVERTGPASALRALDERVPGISLNQAQGNPFQPNLEYRGFEASPLAGDPQGLAVYVNGTRFNQPFGDTTNFDLIPDIAIDRLDVVGANPAFGLNALGGAISVKLRDGFTYHGTSLELTGGSFGRVQASAQYGVRAGDTAAYVAATGLDEDGWRDRSPSQLRQIYADVGWRGESTEVHVNVLGAVNNLTGNGVTPVELLAVSRSAVFTTPDQTRNRYGRVAVQAIHDVTDALSLQASAYYSNLSQRTYNGDATDATPCASDATVLCTGDGSPLATRDGTPIAAGGGGPYSALNQTATDTNAYGVALQATYAGTVLARPNRLLAGASYDGGVTGFSARSLLGTLSPDRSYTAPGVTIDDPADSNSPVSVSATNNYYGLYVSDTLDVTSALSLTASGRLNVARIDLRDRNGTALDGRHAYTRFNPAVGLTYRIAPWLTAYAGYAETNRTPTPAELSCASPAATCTLTNFFVADPSLKQVVARTYEAGLRGRFSAGGAQISWNAGLYRTDSDDDILFTFSDVAGRGYFQNIGATRRQGVESGIDIRRGALLAFLNYTYTDATFRTPFLEGSQNNPFANADGSVSVRAGNQIPGIPQHRLKFGVQYDVTPSWTVGTTGIASSGQYLAGDPSNLTPRTGAYFVLNLNTSYRVTEHVELFGSVQNATNARYATFGGFSPVSLVPIAQVQGGATNPRSLSPGAPVAGYGGLRVTF